MRGLENPATQFVRFMRMVRVPSNIEDCWIWTGTLSRRYGHFTVTSGVTEKAHRWIYELVVGPIDDGLLLRHKCDHPSCVNPVHLEPGTPKDNIQDCVVRGRKADRRGQKHPLVRLSDDDVRQIRKLASIGQSQKGIAGIYGISRSHVGRIVTRKGWRHI